MPKPSLLPCECGNESIECFSNAGPQRIFSDTKWFVGCKHCNNHVSSITIEDARRQWNARQLQHKPDRLVQGLLNLEAHADAIMKVPASEQYIGLLQAVISAAVLEIRACIEELSKR